MTVPTPQDFTRRCDDLVTFIAQAEAAYRAAHDDLYTLSGSGFDAPTTASSTSDPVGARFDCPHDFDCDCPDPTELSRSLKNASNALDSARAAVTRILYGSLDRYRHQERSRKQPDLGPSKRRTGQHDEPTHLLLGAGPCPHGLGDARCRRCAADELREAHEAKQRREAS